MSWQAVGFVGDHFVYEVARASRGTEGLCEKCGLRFSQGELVRVSPELNRDGFCHEACPGGSGS